MKFLNEKVLSYPATEVRQLEVVSQVQKIMLSCASKDLCINAV